MLGGDEGDSGLLGAMGIPETMWDQMRDQAVLGIWPENWQAVDVFSTCQTQWRIGMSGPTGLDYSAVKAVFDMFGVEDPRDTLDNVRTMEAQALEIFASKNGR